MLVKKGNLQMKREFLSWLALSAVAFLLAASTSKAQQSHPMNMFGNVSGWVKDQETAAPIKGAYVYVLTSGDDPEDSARSIDKELVSSSENFKPKGISDENGRFLINSVPTSEEGPMYSVLVASKGYRSYLIKNFAVPPGASLSFDFRILLKKGEGKMEVIEKSKINSISFDRYGHSPAEDESARMMADVGFSPKKDKIALARLDWTVNPAASMTPASYDFRYTLWTIDLMTNRATCLAGEDTEYINISNPSWSPDGSWIAFAGATRGTPGKYSGGIWVVDSSGNGLSKVPLTIHVQVLYHSPMSWKGGHTLVIQGAGDFGCETGTLKPEN